MLLLTGATGTIGLPLLRRLTAAGVPVRCLVRDPRRLGAERVRVQIALGDLGDPSSFRHALRDVDTVVHLASPIRDQPSGPIEELAGAATVRLLESAERAAVGRFVFFSVTGASSESRARLLRAKATAERAVLGSSLAHTVFTLSAAYTPGDPFLTLLERMARLPVVPISGSGEARFEPIWAEDVADCVVAALPGGPAAAKAVGARYELAGPQVLSYREMVEVVLTQLHRRRRIVNVPLGVIRPPVRLLERVAGPHAFTTWDELELLEVSLLSARGPADAERLGVRPRPMDEVLAGPHRPRA